MSFQDLVITISAENLASAEFNRVAANAADMAAEVSAQPLTITVEDLATADVNRVAEEVNVLSTNFETCSVEAENMGAEVLEATESVSAGFEQAAEEAENMGDKISISGSQIREGARDLTRLGIGVNAIARLGEQFGFLNAQQASWVHTIGMSLTAIGAVVRAIQILSSITGIATAIQNALNISHATFLALTGVGIAVIVAAAAAMWYFASQMNAATESVKGYNAAASEMPSNTRAIQRAGEASYYRRGIED